MCVWYKPNIHKRLHNSFYDRVDTRIVIGSNIRELTEMASPWSTRHGVINGIHTTPET